MNEGSPQPRKGSIWVVGIIIFGLLIMELSFLIINISGPRKVAINKKNDLHQGGANVVVPVANITFGNWKGLDSQDSVKFIATPRNAGASRATLVDIVISEVNRLHMDMKMSFLSDEKRNALERIERETKVLSEALVKPGQQTKETLKLMGELAAGAELRRSEVLTPDELLQYHLRTGKAAYELPIEFNSLTPSE